MLIFFCITAHNSSAGLPGEAVQGSTFLTRYLTHNRTAIYLATGMPTFVKTAKIVL
jgi:hypothetical protein